MEGEFDVRGRVFLITGGDKGLGLETVRRLVGGGGRVIIGCRDSRFFGQERDEALRALCNDLECGGDQVRVLYLDLARLNSVKTFCDNIVSDNDVIDVLICNAGVMFHGAEAVTEDGLEVHFSVNYLGHFLMVQQLRPLLDRSKTPRVVAVSSILLRDGHVDIDNLGSPVRHDDDRRTNATPQAYCDSKLMLTLFAQELQRRAPHLSVFSVSPGWCRTSLGRTARIPCYSYPLLAALMLVFGNSVRSGADSIVFCASGGNVQHLWGRFVRKRKVYEKIETVLESHKSFASRLWEESETQLKKILDTQG